LLPFISKFFVFLSAIQKHTYIEIYKTVTFPVVLCGFDTWSVTLREEHTVRTLGNMVLIGIFEPKRK
jgi:hypothetical protein